MPKSIPMSSVALFKLAIASLLLICSTFSSYAATLNIGVMLSEEGGSYQEFAEGLKNQLSKQNISLTVIPLGKTLVEMDLIVAVGTKAATTVAISTSTPVLSVFISRETFVKLQRDIQRRDSSLSAIYLDQPIDRQLNLITAAIPAARNIGLIYNHAPTELRGLRNRTAERKLKLHEQEVKEPGNLPVALQEILRNSDAILALPDVDIYNASTIRNILLAAYRAKVPIIGFSASFVRAGAVCAVFTSPAQLSQQVASTIKQFAESKSLPPAQYAHDFEVHVNEQVARSLGLNMPSSAELKEMIGERK